MDDDDLYSLSGLSSVSTPGSPNPRFPGFPRLFLIPEPRVHFPSGKVGEFEFFKKDFFGRTLFVLAVFWNFSDFFRNFLEFFQIFPNFSEFF